MGIIRKRRLAAWVAVCIIAAVVIAFLFGGDGLWTSFALSRKVSRLEARVDSLATTNELLKKKLEGLKSNDPETLEEEARSHGMIKPGERVYLLKPESERKSK